MSWADLHAFFVSCHQLSLSRETENWGTEPEEQDEPLDLISMLERPSFDLLDYINWCRFWDRDIKAKIVVQD